MRSYSSLKAVSLGALAALALPLLPAYASGEVDWSNCEEKDALLAVAQGQATAANAFWDANGIDNLYQVKLQGGHRTVEPAAGHPLPFTYSTTRTLWQGAADCAWFPELLDIISTIRIPPHQMGPNQQGWLIPTDPGWDSSVTYASALGVQARGFDHAGADGVGPQGEDWRDYLELLPMWRWQSLTVPTKYSPHEGGLLTQLGALIVDLTAGFLFALATFVWVLMRGLFFLAELINTGTWSLFGRTINAVFASIADQVGSFFGIVAAVVGFSLVRAYLSGRRLGDSVRAMVSLILFASLFWLLADGSSRAVQQPNRAEFQLRRGTAAWAGYTVVNLTSTLTAPFAQASANVAPRPLDLGVDERAEGIAGEVIGDRSARPMDSSCAAYSAALYGLAADGRVTTQLQMMSMLWEATYLASFTRGQFGQSFEGDLPGHAVCHLGDERGSVPPRWRHHAMTKMWTGAEEAYNVEAVFFRYHTGRGRNNSQPAEAFIAAAACRYANGSWVVAPQFAGSSITPTLCREIFQVSRTNRNLIGSDGWGFNTERDGPAKGEIQQLFGSKRDAEARHQPDSVEGNEFLAAISPGEVGRAMQLSGGFGALLSTLLITPVFAMLFISYAISGLLAVLAIGFLFPVLLILLALQSSKAKNVARLAGSMLVVNLLVSAVLAFVLLTVRLVRGMVLSFSLTHGLISELFIALAPLVALFVLNVAAKSMGLSSFFSFSGLLNPLRSAMQMSGVKSLKDFATNDADGKWGAQRWMEARRGMRIPGTDMTLGKLSDNMTDMSLRNAFFNKLQGSVDDKGKAKKAGVWGKLGEMASQTVGYRAWDREKKDRDLVQRGAEIAAKHGKEMPTNSHEAQKLIDEEKILDSKEFLDKTMLGGKEKYDALLEEKKAELEEKEAAKKAMEEGDDFDADDDDYKKLTSDYEKLTSDVENLQAMKDATEKWEDAVITATNSRDFAGDRRKYADARALFDKTDPPGGREKQESIEGISEGLQEEGRAAADYDLVALEAAGVDPSKYLLAPDEVEEYKDQFKTELIPDEQTLIADNQNIEAKVQEESSRAAATLMTPEERLRYRTIEAMASDTSGTPAEVAARRLRASDLRTQGESIATPKVLNRHTAASERTGGALTGPERAQLKASYVADNPNAGPIEVTPSGTIYHDTEIQVTSYINGTPVAIDPDHRHLLKDPYAFVDQRIRSQGQEAMEAALIVSGLMSYDGRRLDTEAWLQDYQKQNSRNIYGTEAGAVDALKKKITRALRYGGGTDEYSRVLENLRARNAASVSQSAQTSALAGMSYELTDSVKRARAAHLNVIFQEDPNNPDIMVLDRDALSEPFRAFGPNVEAMAAELDKLEVKVGQHKPEPNEKPSKEYVRITERIESLKDSRARAESEIKLQIETLLSTAATASSLAPCGSVDPAEVKKVFKEITKKADDLMTTISDRSHPNYVEATKDMVEYITKDIADAIEQGMRLQHAVTPEPPTPPTRIQKYTEKVVAGVSYVAGMPQARATARRRARAARLSYPWLQGGDLGVLAQDAQRMR